MFYGKGIATMHSLQVKNRRRGRKIDRLRNLPDEIYRKQSFSALSCFVILSAAEKYMFTMQGDMAAGELNVVQI